VEENGGKAKQQVVQTDEFRELVTRIGYAQSTQYHILRGDGTFKSKKHIHYHTEIKTRSH